MVTSLLSLDAGWWLSPEYSATAVSAPALVKVVLQDALPSTSGTASHRTSMPRLNVTVPVGAGSDPPTVATMVTGWPTTGLSGDTVSVVCELPASSPQSSVSVTFNAGGGT